MKILKNDFCYFSYIEYDKKYFSPRRYVEDSYYNLEKNYIKQTRYAYGFLEKETECFYTFRIANEKGHLYRKGNDIYVCKFKKDNVDILRLARKDDASGKYRWLW